MKTLAPTSDYTSIAPLYDNTRNIPDGLLSKLYQRVQQKIGLSRSRPILDAGCGTAQISLPLIASGFNVVGVDVSEAMLRIARDKAAQWTNAKFQVGDVRQLEFSDGYFQGVVVSKLFQHVGGWQEAVDELLRVAEPGGFFLHVNEKGAFKNLIRKKFSETLKTQGVNHEYVGIRDRSQLGAYLHSKKCDRIELDVADLKWTKAVKLVDALEHLRLRLHSEYWSIPQGDYDLAVRTVQSWLEAQPKHQSATEEMTPFLTAELYRLRK